METLVIEAVSAKFANKYNSGSVKAGGKWYQVSSKLDISDFRKDAQVTVETKTNDKGYTSITGFAKSQEAATKAVEEVIEQSQVEAKTKTSKRAVKEERSYEDSKGRKILVQGITQAVAQSTMLAGLPFTSASEAVNLIKEVSLALIEFVDEESR